MLETPPLAARLPTPTNAAVRANHTQLQLKACNKAIRQHPAERREQSMLVRLRCSACSLSARAAGARSTASRGPQFLGRGAAAGQVAPGRAADVRLLSTAPDDADTRLAAVLKDIQSKIQAAAPENDPVEGTKTRGPKMVLRFTCTCADCVENSLVNTVLQRSHYLATRNWTAIAPLTRKSTSRLMFFFGEGQETTLPL